MGYPIGRIVVENMRTDPANHILGQRVNTWISILVFLLGLWLWRWFGRRADAPAVPGVGAPGSPVDEADRADTADMAEETDQPDDTDQAVDSVSPSETPRIKE